MSEARTYAALHTDLGNAERMVQRYRHKLRYVSGWGWMVFNGKFWERDTTGAVERFAKDTIRSLYAEAEGLDTQDDLRALIKHALQSERATAIRAMIEHAKTEPQIATPAQEFDSNAELFNCANGTLHIPSGELRKHSAGDLITKFAPVEHNAEATCPRWCAMIHAMMAGRRDVVALLQRWFGYCLTGDTTEQKFVIMVGEGQNGKGALMRTCETLFGTYYQTADFSAFSEHQKNGAAANPEIARLDGPRLVVASESNGAQRMDEARLKSLTGQDTITARHLYHEPVSFRPVFKLMLISNEWPRISGTDFGIWRRIVPISCDVKIADEDIDTTLEPALQGPELPGILNWMLAGYADYKRLRGLAVPDSIRNTRADYRTQQDVFAEFLDTQCMQDPSANESASVLLARLNSNLPRPEQYSAKKLAAELKRRDFRSVRGSSGVRWIGLRVLPMNEGYVGSVGSLTNFSNTPPREELLEVPAQASQAAFVARIADDLLCVSCRSTRLSSPGLTCFTCLEQQDTSLNFGEHFGELPNHTPVDDGYLESLLQDDAA